MRVETIKRVENGQTVKRYRVFNRFEEYEFKCPVFARQFAKIKRQDARHANTETQVLFTKSEAA